MTDYTHYREAWEVLSPTQKARVMLKQQWEGCTRLAVFGDWPSLFDATREQDKDELYRCRQFIAERPELFPELADDVTPGR